jgi:hypothetical protein
MFAPFCFLPFVFSDGSRFRQVHDPGWVCRRREEYVENIFALTSECPKFSIMLCDAIGVNFKSKLLIVVANIDIEKYRVYHENSPSPPVARMKQN